MYFLLNYQKQTYFEVKMMSNNLEVSIFEIVGSPLCVASGDGQKVYDRLAAALKEGRRVIVSFYNVTTLTSAFLNAAIGQLYGTFSEEQIRTLLKVQDMQADDLALLKRVVDTAKLYFKDPQTFKRVLRETMEGEDSDT
jgi:hypothetical protein